MVKDNVTPAQDLLRKSLAKVSRSGFTYIDLYKKAGWHSSDWNAHWRGDKRRTLSVDLEDRMKKAVIELTKKRER